MSAATLDRDPAEIERRLRERAARMLVLAPADVCALVYRSRQHGGRGWIASVSTRDGLAHLRCWGPTADAAAARVVETMSRGG